MTEDNQGPVKYPGLLELTASIDTLREGLIPIIQMRYARDLTEDHRKELDGLITSITTRVVMELHPAVHSFQGEKEASVLVH